MDSANPSIVTRSTSKLSKLAPSKRALFLATYRRNQAWSLPKPIIEYIANNPLSPKLYEKLIKSCKYFFVRNPLLLVSYLFIDYEEDEWRTYFNGKRVVDLRDISSKLWLNNELTVEDCGETRDVQYFSTIILPRIFKSDIKKLILTSQNIIHDDLIWLASKCEEIDLSMVTVKNNDDCVVTLDKIFGALPNLKDFYYDFENTDPNIVTSDTVKEMVKIPHFLTLKHLNFTNAPESFNLDDFYSYIKKNKETDVHFRCFTDDYSDAYKHRFQEIINEIIGTEKHEYEPPYICFSDIDQASFEKLCSFYRGL